ASTSVGTGCLRDESVVCWEAGKDISFTEKNHDVDNHEKEKREEWEKENVELTTETGKDMDALTTFKSLEKDDALCLVSDDPGKWPINLTYSQVQYIIENFPSQVQNIAFPRDEQNKKISESYFYRTLSNGEKIHRPWLLYSLSLNSVFCAPCKLFCTDVTEKKERIYGKEGVNDWQQLSLILKRHESRLIHIKYTKQMHDLSVAPKKGTTIDSSNQRLYELEKIIGVPLLKD
ncbi:zinc finger MYM-type protein 5-like, partial [Stegodyphus dumicola]|uniref:zinc finger MYM-type protein 5-like n=1 Tax=Stegodyphus dumicola TaxID=202533 RepID=UPI0015AF2299